MVSSAVGGWRGSYLIQYQPSTPKVMNNQFRSESLKWECCQEKKRRGMWAAFMLLYTERESFSQVQTKPPIMDMYLNLKKHSTVAAIHVPIFP